MAYSFGLPMSEQFFDTMQFGGYIPGTQTRGFADAGCGFAFQIQQNNLAVQRFEPIDQFQKRRDRELLIGVESPILVTREMLHGLQVDKPGRNSAAADNVIGGYIMRDAIHPSAQAAALVKTFQA
ncbi:MAG TPA: hypothetical protein VMB18_05850 [Terriglobales bacterium]|nr:hypothetical protein [Terriglobales bacterium]